VAVSGKPKKESWVVRNPKVLEREPSIRGTRISVRSVVLAAREYGGVQGAMRAYPHLSEDAVQEALSCYEAHTEEIDRHIGQNAKA